VGQAFQPAFQAPVSLFVADGRLESLPHRLESLPHRLESLPHRLESLPHRLESLPHSTFLTVGTTPPADLERGGRQAVRL